MSHSKSCREAKRKVLKQRPGAFVHDEVKIVNGYITLHFVNAELLGRGPDACAAWEDAARRL